jgi:protein TonB
MKLDILKNNGLISYFEGRNKTYGAYELRKSNKNSIKALILETIFFVSIGTLI